MCDGAIFGNYGDSFWTASWAAELCQRDDILGQYHLVVGTGYRAAMTQDAEQSFKDAVEAARFCDVKFRSRVGLIVGCVKVWLAGLPFVQCDCDLDEQAAKAWLSGAQAVKDLQGTADPLRRAHEKESGQ
eukprot:4328993-Pyramimonas_sp.AAC.1